MIKLIYLGAVPLLAAYIYGDRNPEPMVPRFHSVEQADRIFLANLDTQDAAAREASVPREASAPVPVAVPVAIAVPVAKPNPMRAAMPIPVARAIPVVRDAPEQPAAQTAIAHETTATPAVADLGTTMEVRRAIPVVPHHTVYRAANGSYQGEVFTFPAYGSTRQ